jgi:hypothetical protein
VSIRESGAASASEYSGMAQALHRLTAILVLVAFIYGPGGSEQRVYSPARDAQRQLHETLGNAFSRSRSVAQCGEP